MRPQTSLLNLCALAAAALAIFLAAPAVAEDAVEGKGIQVNERQAEAWLKGRRHALIVGISDYQHLRARKSDPGGKEQAYDLDFADDDALAVQEFLKKDLKYDTVLCLTEAQATRDKILERFGDLVAAAKPFDTVFVYLSGHGFRRGKKTYFMPYDAKLNLLRHHGIALDEVFASDLRQCGADHKLLVLDCCHSGAATGKAVEDSASFSQDELRDLSGRGLYILTSCKKDQVAYEDEQTGHGYFTRYFLEALRKGQADQYRKGNHDGLVSADEVYLYLYDHLPDAVRTAKRGLQTPQREVPEEGQTLIARIGKLKHGEVTFRLKSIPPEALVLINDEEHGKTPVETSLELGVTQRVVATKEGFLPWERKLNPQRREPIELTAALTPKGVQADTRYAIALDMYKRNKVEVAQELMLTLIKDKKEDAPKALLFLFEHSLKKGDLRSAEARADELRKDYGAFDESAQADRTLYEDTTAKLDAEKPSERGMAWHKSLILALKHFLDRQAGNRYAAEASRRIENSRSSVTNLYLAEYNGLVERLLGDLEDAEFGAARRRLAKARESLGDAARGGYEPELSADRRPDAVEEQIGTAERAHAEQEAYDTALDAAASATDPGKAAEVWDKFLKAWPENRFAPRAGDFLSKAKTRARAWHDAEYEKAIAEARKAKGKKDYGPASRLVALALTHRPGDDAAVTLQRELVPVIVVETTPAGAAVEILPPTGQASLTTRSGKSPFRAEVERNAVYVVRVSMKGYRSESKAVRIGEGGEYEVRITMEESKLPPGLEEAFEVPAETKDAHRNPIRKGTDEKTGWPLEIRHKATGLHLVFIPAGTFQMGSNAGEDDEKPVHKITLTKPFYLGKCEVTQGEWQQVMGNNPSSFKGDRNPVERVSWDDCQEFLKKLSGRVGSARFSVSSEERAEARTTNLRFSLPTEAQWEYACRAGSTTKYCFGGSDRDLDDYAWYDKNSRRTTHPVGQKKPNAWGLYDLHGNVWEWCSDWYGGYAGGNVTDPTGPTSGGGRVRRGGRWGYGAGSCRSASRSGGGPGRRNYVLGFRLALSRVQR